MKPLEWNRLARRDFDVALARYKSLRPGLQLRFHAAVQKILQAIQEFPESGAPSQYGGTRFKIVKKFPYSVHYLEFEDRIGIAAVAHHSRRPGYWRKRLRNF
jgi:toxin ParE1/3/4